MEEPRGGVEGRSEGPEGAGEGAPQPGVQLALRGDAEIQAAQSPLRGQRHQDHQVQPAPLPPHEPLRAVPPNGQHLLRGPGRAELHPGGERLPAGDSPDPHLRHAGSDGPEGRLGGFQEIPVGQEAQQHAVLDLQQVR